LKNKTKTYLLLAAVLGVWGIIGYKIVNGLSPDISEITEQEFTTTFKPKANTEAEKFFIQNTERDPFLGTLVNKRKSLSTSKTNKQKSLENLPVITYGGLVKKQNTSDQVFVININNKQYLLKKNQVVDSVTLIRGNAKEIVVRYNNKSQTIKRQ